jgi:hypothetical protein
MLIVNLGRAWGPYFFADFDCLRGIAAGQGGEVVVPVEDKSQAGSPVDVSGKVSFSETVIANEVSTTRSELVQVRDISGRPILLFVASLSDSGPRSSPQDVEITADDFFKDKTLLPQEESDDMGKTDGRRAYG